MPGRITPRKLNRLKAWPTQKADVNHRQSARASAQGSEAEPYHEDKEKTVQTLDLSLWVSGRVGVRAPTALPHPPTASGQAPHQGQVPGETRCPLPPGLE